MTKGRDSVERANCTKACEMVVCSKMMSALIRSYSVVVIENYLTYFMVFARIVVSPSESSVPKWFPGFDISNAFVVR